MLNKLEQQRQHFRPELHRVREQLRNVEEFYEAAHLRGQISGIYRRYRAELLVVITGWAIDRTPHAQPTKYSVAAWQKKTFQRSLSNDYLAKLWCDPSRTPGERGSLAIGERTAELAVQAFALYSASLDDDPEPATLEALAATLLENDLSL